MVTPETRASSTSPPSLIILNARATQVTPFSSFERLPLADATTHGFTPFGVIIVGLCAAAADAAPSADCDVAAATLAAVVVRTNSRRFTFIEPHNLVIG